MIANERNIAEKIACGNQSDYPDSSAGDVIELKLCERHSGHAGDKRCEGAHDRDKARQDDGLTAMVFIECMRFLQCMLIQPFVIMGKYLVADCAANPVIDGIASYSG